MAARVDVEITPNTGVYTDTELNCLASAVNMEGAGEPVFTWISGGAEIATGTSYTISADDLNVDDSLSCSASITDGSGITLTGTSSIVVENSVPVISAVNISSETNFNDEMVSCLVEVSDIDQEELIIEYSWISGSENLGSSDTLDLNTTELMPEDRLNCHISVSDGHDSISQDSSAMEIENRPPSPPNISLSWSSNNEYPLAGESLTCLGSDSVDPDRQEVQYSYSWSSSSGALLGQESVPLGQIVSPEVWTCTVETTDGLVSETVTASITVCDSLFQGSCMISSDLSAEISLQTIMIPAGQDPLERYSLSNSFYLMQTEVTQPLFEQIMGYPASEGEETSDETGSFGVGEEYPAYHVSWYMAADFANHVTQYYNQENGANLQECYTCAEAGTTNVVCTESMNPYLCDGYRLPTSGEWEYAARSGTMAGFWTPDGGGDESGYECTGTETIVDGGAEPLLGEYSWYCGNMENEYGAKKVAQKLPNGFGLYDMHGNVREWVGDWYNYGGSQLYGVDPFDDNVELGREYRGGSWMSYPYVVNLTERYSNPSDLRFSRTGLRLARGQ